VTEVVLDAESVPTPEPMLQVTPALVESFVTVGVKTCDAPPASVTGVGLTETVMGVGVENCPPPQPASRSRHAERERMDERFMKGS
jgi:hypothetical protein